MTKILSTKHSSTQNTIFSSKTYYYEVKTRMQRSHSLSRSFAFYMIPIMSFLAMALTLVDPTGAFARSMPKITPLVNQMPTGAWSQIGPLSPTIGTTMLSNGFGALAVDPTTSGSTTTMYLAPNDGGLFKTTNDGTSWSPVMDTLPSGVTWPTITHVVVDPENHNTVFAVTQSGANFQGILETTNGGTSWTQITPTALLNEYGVSRLFVNQYNDQDMFALAFNNASPAVNEVLYSTNGGANWTSSSIATADWESGAANALADLAVGFSGSVSSYTEYLYAVGIDPGGANVNEVDVATATATTASSTPTWAAATATDKVEATSVTATTGASIALASSIPSTLAGVYVSVKASAAPGFYYYNTGGPAFAQQGTAITTVFTDMSVDPQNPTIVYGLTSAPALYVINDATTGSGAGEGAATLMNVPGTTSDREVPRFPSCASGTDPCPAVFANDGGLFYSTAPNVATPSTALISLTGVADVSFGSLNGAIGAGYSSSPEFYGVSNTNYGLLWNGSTWTMPDTSSLSATSVAIDQSNNAKIYYATGSFIYVSNNSGATFGSINAAQTPFVIDPANDSHIVSNSTTANDVWESTNGGVSGNNSAAGFTTAAIAIDPTNSTVVFVGGTSHLSEATNADSASTTYTSLSTAYTPVSIVVDSHDSTGNTAYFATSSGVYEVSSATSTPAFTAFSTTGLPASPEISQIGMYYSGNTPVFVALASGTLTSNSLYYTTSTTAAWTKLSSGLPSAPINGFAINKDHTAITAYTQGRGAWVLALPTAKAQSVGVYSPSTGTFFLNYSNTAGTANVTVQYGPANSTPLIGDWTGQGFQTVGVYNNGVFYLKNSDTAGNADITFQYGPINSSAVPLVGDWTGQGKSTIGIYLNGTFYLKNSNAAGSADITFNFGGPGDIPVVGDWSGSGHTSVGVYDPSTGTFYLKNTLAAGLPDYTFAYGPIGSTPIAGDWTGQGFATVGVYDTNTFFLKNSNAAGNADTTFMYGFSGTVPLVGNYR